QLRPPRLPSLPRRPAHVRGRQAGGAGIAGGAEGLHPALQRRAPGRRDPIRLRRNAAPELLGPGDDLETYGELSSGRSMQTLGSRGYVGRPNSVQARYNAGTMAPGNGNVLARRRGKRKDMQWPRPIG